MSEPPDRYVLTPENYDGVTSALIGNGELCTTVGPTGYHTPPDEQTDIAHRTQHFVLAGRRAKGPGHSLLNLGSLSMEVFIDGSNMPLESYWQDILPSRGRVHSIGRFENGLVCDSDTLISMDRKLFVVGSGIYKRDRSISEVELRVRYAPGTVPIEWSAINWPNSMYGSYQTDTVTGTITVGMAVWPVEIPWSLRVDYGTVLFSVQGPVAYPPEKGTGLHASTWVHFSDRITYEFPVETEALDSCKKIHASGWGRFRWTSDVETGDEQVDRFRRMSLYNLRCQATPWSVPPTVSEEYWGAGAFHDEMYPFLGLLSSNHVELAERIPYFRLSTLPQAMQRARGRGALYPWSSTEYGEERDPNGLWLTERFHLGQFAVCIWMLWLYNRDRIQLDDLYPVLREIARYFEMNMLERDEEGRLRTKACVDFDESVGPVTNGPFTICAAIASLEYAANAAEELGKDPERIPRWRELAGELRLNLPGDRTTGDTGDTGKDVFGIPGGKPLHYSILGPIFPFRVEVDSERAKASAEYIHRVCRSTKGWKPGFSEVFEGSNWMWTAAHLGIVHAMQGNAELAWEAIKEAPASAGPFLSPNEHVDKDGVIHVPWFTTGCGGWLYALNCLFVQVDEEGTKLLPAVPATLSNARFCDLRADRAVLVSAEFKYGVLARLSARAPKPMPWSYRIPSKYAEQANLGGKLEDIGGGWLRVSLSFADTESVSLLDTTPYH